MIERSVTERLVEPLRIGLADELDLARSLIETMGDELAGDLDVVARHSIALQSVDIVGQMLGHVAAVIRAGDPHEAIESIGMGELKARLQRALDD